MWLRLWHDWLYLRTGMSDDGWGEEPWNPDEPMP